MGDQSKVRRAGVTGKGWAWVVPALSAQRPKASLQWKRLPQRAETVEDREACLLVDYIAGHLKTRHCLQVHCKKLTSTTPS